MWGKRKYVAITIYLPFTKLYGASKMIYSLIILMLSGLNVNHHPQNHVVGVIHPDGMHDVSKKLSTKLWQE